MHLVGLYTYCRMMHGAYSVKYPGLCFRRFRKISKSDYQLRHISICLSVCLSTWKNSAFTSTDFRELGVSVFPEHLLRKLNFYQNMARITGTLHGDVCPFMVISRCIRHRMRNISDKSCRENQISHLALNNFFYLKCTPVFDTMCKTTGCIVVCPLLSWVRGLATWLRFTYCILPIVFCSEVALHVT